MPEPLDSEVIDRYLAGDASPAEMAKVRAHRESDPAWADAIEVLRAKYGRRASERWDVNAAWSRLRPALRSERPASPRETHPGTTLQTERSRLLAPRLWLVAAALLAAVGVTTWRVAAGRPDGTTGQATAMREMVTPNGSRNTFTLDDGSRVTLNAGSRLRWALDFGARTRDVYLEGEAYFTVTHDRARPFRVHTRGAVAHDLGTRFAVRAYPELTGVEVVVAEGSVSLRRDAATDSAVIVAGQLGRIGDSGPPTVESNVAVEPWIAWTGGALVLDGLTLREALPQLERWYDATITVADSTLARRRVSARFHDETLPQMLDALTLALGARWQQSGRSITLMPNNR